jgi:hypothetical protein
MKATWLGDGPYLASVPCIAKHHRCALWSKNWSVCLMRGRVQQHQPKDWAHDLDHQTASCNARHPCLSTACALRFAYITSYDQLQNCC